MSINHSAKVVTDGLVMYYDMSNAQKSWKGAPTTNLVPNANLMSGWNNYSNGPASPYTTDLGTAGWFMNNAGSWNGCYRGISGVTPGVYTFSCWAKYLGGHANQTGGAVYVSGYGGGDSAQYINKSISGWQRITHTLNVTTTSLTFYLISWGGTNNSDNSSWQVTMPQMELSAYATPFVNGTRTNTQAIVDFVGNKTITPTNLNSTSYLDNTCITLDGNNQYLYTSGDGYWNAWSPDGTNGNTSMTIELIFNSSDTGGLLISRPWNGSGQYNYTISNAGFGLHSNASGANLAYSSICTGATVHMVWWMNSTQYGVYKNGVEYVAATNHGLSGNGGSAGSGTFGTLFGSLYPYGEGWGGNTGFSVAGKYYLAKIYNRALSAAEVAQNFNALRRRYSL